MAIAQTMPIIPSPSRTFASAFVPRLRWLLVVVFAASILMQFIIDQSLNNFVCTWIAAIVSLVTFFYSFNVRRFRQAPMSHLMIVGFNISALSGALLIQSVARRSLVYNLDSPVQTFAVLAFTQLLTIGVHMIYVRSRLMRALRRSFTHYVAAPLGLLQAPSNLQLWIFGLAGCAATVLAARGYQDGVEFGNVSGKFAVSFTPFAVAPFFIPVRAYLMGARSARNGNWIILTGYAMLLIGVAIVNNARATFSVGFLTLGLSGLIAVLTGNLAVSRRTLAGFALTIVLGAPLFMVLSDLATAMVIARDERSIVSPIELLEITLANFQDKALIAERRHRDAVISGDEYNENYIEQPIFARFVYTKFVDVNLTNALTLSNGQADDVRHLTWDRILAMLPTPILNALHIDVNKADLGYSSGDIYSFIARGLEKGAYTTGSEVPDGLTIFGLLFWPVLTVMLLAQFIVYDGFAVIDRRGQVVIGVIALLNITPLFTLGVMQESISNQVIAIVRGIPQLIFIYSLIFIGSAVLIHPKRAAARMMAVIAGRLL